MIKRTLCFEKPAYLHTRNEQLVISREGEAERTVPIEDIGMIIIDNDRISLSKTLMARMLDNNTAVVVTDNKHMPSGLFLPLEANTLQQERFTKQLNIPEPLKKRLWQQTIRAKIRNQALVLKSKGVDSKTMTALIPKVRSGDPANVEAVAARRYWKLLFAGLKFKRGRFGDSPNDMFNYGYAILRALIARSLIGAGLLPLIGIHHRNRYNAYPLADDIMEPFRPFVDVIVYSLVTEKELIGLDRETKRELLQLPHSQVKMNGEQSPLMLAASNTAVGLYRCFTREAETILFPEPWN